MADLIREIEYELFESQSEIIRLQSEAIIGLVSLIAQHKDIDDTDFAPIKEKIDLAAQIRAEHDL
ncbi:MAG: hypothetical protein IJ641_07890 [Lachnospiraceae bacterium]|nr:hypothetical protein [Lachnospiraceae bacterium]